MKLVIQIPCYNEEATLPRTISELPRQIPGIDLIEYLVIDDGSTDDTIRVARENGAHHILHIQPNRGLANAFIAGLRYAVRAGADIVVNTDADNQYKGECILDLITPIQQNQADMVVGCRPIRSIPHFSGIKKLLQRLGSWTLTRFTGMEIPDATSGFRAYSRYAAQKLNVFSDFSYTLETLIQASRSDLRVAHVPVRINPPTRPSRLFRSNWFYIRKQIHTILRIWALYSPVKLYSRLGFINLGLGSLLLIRFLYYYLSTWPGPTGKIQSLILSAVFLLFGLFLVLAGVLADLLVINRQLLENIRMQLETGESVNHAAPPDMESRTDQ